MYNFDNKQKLKLYTLVINLLHFLSVRLHIGTSVKVSKDNEAVSFTSLVIWYSY